MSRSVPPTGALAVLNGHASQDGRRVVRELVDSFEYPDAHAEAVAELAARIAEQLEVSRERLRTLAVGALLHDVGKLTLDERILAKPGPLDPSEWSLVRTHPDEGERLLRGALTREALAVVRWHHERWDGSGYPDGLRGEQIPLGARIVAVADAFCTMLEHRPYRRPVEPAAAMTELERESGAQFDPACVDALLSVLGRQAA